MQNIEWNGEWVCGFTCLSWCTCFPKLVSEGRPLGIYGCLISISLFIESRRQQLTCEAVHSHEQVSPIRTRWTFECLLDAGYVEQLYLSVSTEILALVVEVYLLRCNKATLLIFLFKQVGNSFLNSSKPSLI